MKPENKKWAFTEILGTRENVERTLCELNDAQLIHGTPCSREDKGDKRLVQFYECHEDMTILSPEEQEQYKIIARNCQVYIEYSFMGKVVMDFPSDTGHGFCLKYWEWWMR